MDASTTELRCPECNKLLAKANLTPGSKVEIMCPRWKAHENKEIKLMRFCQA
jgi:phage FluMu protein Com